MFQLTLVHIFRFYLRYILCPIQFINTGVHWYKHFFTDPDTYKLEFAMVQNVTTDMGIVHYDDPLDPSRITSIDVKTMLVLYKDSKPYRWLDCVFESYDDGTYTFNFKAELNTNNMIDSNNCIRINDLNQINSVEKMYGFVDKKSEAKIFVFVKDNERNGRKCWITEVTHVSRNSQQDLVIVRFEDGYTTECYRNELL